MSISTKKHTLIAGALPMCILLSTVSFGQQAQSPPIINKEILYKDIDSLSARYKYFVVVIFTNYCGGTAQINDLIRKIDNITHNQTCYFLCQSTNGRDRRNFQKILDLYKFNATVYLIDEEQYKTRRDHRKQGFFFRNDICGLCKYEAIGVPFYIVFDREKNAILRFFPSSNWEQVLAAIIK